jgi:TRAP-type mannitol/chloroaromatic compound transport system permease small subunit
MLMPLAVLMIYESYGFVLRSYQQQENSSNAGGLIVWPAKALILAGFTLLALQGISEIIKRIAVMQGLIPDPHENKPSEEVLAAEMILKGQGE